MFLDAIVRLYEYQRDANDRILKVAANVSDDDFTATLVDGQPSIRDTLFHMLDVIESHFIWWSFSADQTVPDGPARRVDQYSNIEQLRDLWNLLSARVDDCVESLETDEQLDGTYERKFSDGSSNKRHLWEMLIHVVNHSTQHRSEVAIMLTKLGHSPGDMEIL